MNFKKVLAGALTGTMVVAMGVTAFATPVYYTDDSLEVAEDFSNMTMATLIDETTADADITSFTYTLTCGSDVSFNEYAYVHFVVTVDGVSTDYSVQGITGDDEWTEGLVLADQTLTLDSAIASGSTYKVEAYTQSWAGAADYVYDVAISADAAASTGDNMPVAYLAAAVALAGVALAASKKARA